mgnify:FL=1|tara:strand:- start:4 stop:276 length:273 start_codon:yes stop_codon:yes gene_type:complete
MDCGGNLKPTKNPILGKLNKLSRSINEWIRVAPQVVIKSGLTLPKSIRRMEEDESYLMSLISHVRYNNSLKLCREDFVKCNDFWRIYETN